MMSQDENSVMFAEFLEKGDRRLLIVYVNTQGQLTPTTTYPGVTKTKVGQYEVLYSWSGVTTPHLKCI